MWPAIEKAQLKIISDTENNSKYKMIAIEGAVIIEANYGKYYHEIWCATLSKEIAIQRLMNRDKYLTYAQAKDRIDSQIDDKERLKYCKYSIDKNQTMEEVELILDDKIKQYYDQGILTSLEKDVV